MVDSGMDLNNDKESVANIEIAHYIMLSLYREYSIQMLNNPNKKSASSHSARCTLFIKIIYHALRI